MRCRNGSSPTIERCVFLDNHATTGGGIACEQSSPHLVDCTFTGNHAFEYGGGGVLCTEGSAPTITGCRFTANEATDSGAGITCYGSSPTVTGCVFTGNTAVNNGGGAFYAGFGSTPLITSCTIADNSADIGSGILCYQDSDATLERCIIAFNPTGSATFCLNAASVTLLCCDIFGNPGGDWTWCAAGQLGQDGNTCADPLFCDLAAGDVTLEPDSPCAPENAPGGCGLVGALPVGCGTTAVAEDAATAPAAPRALLRVVPNPVVVGSRIEIDRGGIEAGSPMVLRLHDVQGRLLLVHEIGRFEDRSDAGDHRSAGSGLSWISLPGARDLAAGIYYLSLAAGTPHGGQPARTTVTSLLLLH